MVAAVAFVLLMTSRVGEARAAPQGGASNPLLVLSHLLQGLDPAGPPRLFDDDFSDLDDDTTHEDFLDDEDGNPFSFLG